MDISRLSAQILNQALSHGAGASELKKHRILAATIDLLATDGISSVTFEAIGDKLKTTKANIRYHFSEKDDLIFSAIKLVVLTAQMVTGFLVEKAETPEGKLESIILGAYKHLEIAPSHARVLLIYFYLAGVDPKYSLFYRETRQTGRGRLKLVLQALRHRASPLPNATYEKLADVIQNIITGQVLGSILSKQSAVEGSKLTRDAVRSILKDKGILWKTK